MDAQPLVHILLSTWNGERFLQPQLESLLAQSYQQWSLLIRDDSSTDGTLTLLSKWVKKHPEKVHILEAGKVNLGATASFSWLMDQSDADYLIFCDQDDIWHTEKVSCNLEHIQKMEARYGRNLPILVHSDLRVVNQESDCISESFWKYQNLDASRDQSLVKLMVQNCITGCTVIINRALIKQAAPIPDQALLHDWWLGMVAAAFGKIEHISDALVDYRQHGGNEVGAKKWQLSTLIGSASKPLEMRRRLRETQVQAGAFIDRYQGQLSLPVEKIVWGYARISEKKLIDRQIFLMKHGIYKTGFLRNIGLYLWI